MRILIVDDNEQLAEITADLLHSIDQPAGRIETITLAADLETAIRLLPGHDAVLCDGQFPISQDSGFIGYEWDVVQHAARRRGIHFVLYSGSVRALDEARGGGIPAISKPAAIENIYTLLTEPCLEGCKAAVTDEPDLARHSTWGVNYEAGV